MILKLRLLIFTLPTLFMIMSISGVVSGEDSGTNLKLDIPIITENAMSTTPIVYSEPLASGATYHSILPIGEQTANPFHIAVIGDSIAWGNGLNQEDKYYNQVAEHLRKQLDRPIEITVYAHSGAVISGKSGESKNANLNSGYPSLMEQAEKIQNNVDLILVSGGINDVGIGNILDANTLEDDVRRLSVEKIETPMKELLTVLMEKTAETDAEIIVTGYYPLITDESKLGLQDRVIGGFLAAGSKKTTSQASNVIASGTDPIGSVAKAGRYLGEGAANNVVNFFTDDSKFEANSKAFYETSKKCLVTAVDDVNKAYKGEKRVTFVDPSFEGKNSYGASESFLWKSTSLGKTNDDQYDERYILTNPFNPLDTENRINAIAHPNVAGASRYADLIEAAIKDKESDWRLSATTEETTTAAPDDLLIGTPQSPVKWQEASPIDTSKSNTQGTAQTTSQSTNTPKFSIGAKVETIDSLNLRDAPGTSSGTITSTKTAGSTATVLSGPFYADGFTWWEIQYDDGTSGWSQDKRLELIPANQQPVSQQATVPAISQSNSAKFIKGSTVETTDSLNVRSGPGLSYNTVSNFKTTGSTATIIKGPFYADGFTWWELQYDDGTSGFSQDKRLELVPANQPPVTQQVDLQPVTKYNELAFGDNQLSVTQPVDQQPELAFGDNQQLATQLKERAFWDNQQTGDLQPYTLPEKSNFMQLSGTQFGDYPQLAQNNGYGDHIGKEHDLKYVTYFDNIRKGYYNTPSTQSGSGSLGGLTPEQLRAIQEWIDSGAGQSYDPPVEETNPVFAQCYDGACYDAKGERIE